MIYLSTLIDEYVDLSVDILEIFEERKSYVKPTAKFSGGGICDSVITQGLIGSLGCVISKPEFK